MVDEMVSNTLEYQREWREKNRERYNSYHREYQRQIRARYGARYRRHGITREQWDEMVARFDGMCWACRLAPPTDCDHDHVTGDIRGALCHACNVLAGFSKDGPEHLRQVAAYLEAF